MCIVYYSYYRFMINISHHIIELCFYLSMVLFNSLKPMTFDYNRKTESNTVSKVDLFINSLPPSFPDWSDQRCE